MSCASPQKALSRTSSLKPASETRYLESSEYSKWDDLVQNSPESSVFCRSWWLNAVGEFRILGYFEHDELIAGIPLHFEHRLGHRICTMPRLTPTLGVVMPALSGNANKVAARRTLILGEIAKKLFEYPLVFHAMHPSLGDWLPFYWAGFRQTTRYSYVIDDLTDLRRVWSEMNSNTRKQIAKAETAGIQMVPCGIDDVYNCEYESHVRRGTTPRHTQDILRRIYDAAFQHSSGACSAAIDENGQVLSAYFRVWDSNRTYGLVGGNSHAGRESSAGFALQWHEIQFAAERSRIYDFSGSMMAGVACFNKGFGARPVPYHFIIKAPPPIYCGLQIAGKL